MCWESRWFRYINIDDSEDVLKAIRLTDKNIPIDLILHTPGGLALAGSQIAKAVKPHPSKTTVFVTTDHGFKKVQKVVYPNVVLRKAGLVQAEGPKAVSCQAYAMTQVR